MLKSSRSIGALILVGTLAHGCTSSHASPGAPSRSDGTATLTAAQTAGTWTLSSIQPAGGSEQSVPAGASYELSLSESHASTKADCNICGGGLTVGAQTLTIGPGLACTRAACPTMAFENTYVGILEGESVAQLDRNLLTLTSSRGVLRFRR